MPPLFSVIVPVYKAEPYLRQCVDSILAQTAGDLELILVDDGSPDGCGAICDGCAARDSRVRVLHQPNAGPTRARRNGLAQARGEYVCFVDGDDWVTEDWLEVIRGCIEENGRPDMVLFDLARDTGETEQPMLAPPGFYDKARLEAEIYPYMLNDARRPFGTQLFPGYLVTKAFRRELADAHFLADERISLFEDTAMAYECAYFARSAYITDRRLYVYRRVPQSNGNRYRADYFRQVRMVYDYLSSRLGGKADCLDRQIDAFCMRRLLGGIVGEVVQQDSLPGAAGQVAAAMGETGLARALRPAGLPGPMKLLLLLLKCRLYLPAVLAVRLRM